MREPWIRVHANLVQRPVVARMAEALRIDPFKAMGHLLTFWGSVSAHASNGSIVNVPDALLERWAGWTGKRGTFAAWVRADHTDEDGRVNEWDAYQGKLELKRDNERKRIQKWRDSQRNVTRTENEHNANGNAGVDTHARERNGTERLTTSSTASAWQSDPRWVAFLEAVPPPKHKTFTHLVAQWVIGERWLTKPIPTPDQILDGLMGAVTAKDGTLGENWLRGCIKRVMAGESSPIPRATVSKASALDTMRANAERVALTMQAHAKEPVA